MIVIAPPEPVQLGSDHFAGWWRIDPVTGRTTGVSGATSGECGPEYNLTLRAVLIEAAEEFAMETVLCHGMAQAFNQFVGFMADVQRAGYFAWWTPQLAGAADPLQVAKDNAGVCLIAAITKGMLSTTALLPFLIRGAAEAETTVAIARSRQTLASMEAFRGTQQSALRQTLPSAEPTVSVGNIRDTVPSELTPPTGRGVTTGLSEQAAREQLQQAHAASRAAQTDYFKSVNDFIQLQGGGPPVGGFPQQIYNAMVRDVALKDSIWVQRIQELRAAQGELSAAAARANRTVLGPNLYQVAAGQAGVVGVIR